MSFEKIAEQKIREAMERGEFDNLPGAGQPLTQLDEYFLTPEHVRLGYSILKSANMLSREMQLLRENSSCDARSAPILEKRHNFAAEINSKQLQYDVIMDHYSRSHRSVRKP